jgi:hypothetical protein
LTRHLASPRLAHRTAVGLAIVLIAAAGVLVTARPAAANATESALISKINAARTSRGLAPLTVSSDLTAYARGHSAAMQRQRTLFHTSTWSAICCWRAIAENVGTGTSVTQIASLFMSSSAHRANILDSRMRQVGVGVTSSNGILWVTEIFRQPRGSTGSTTTPTRTYTVRPLARQRARASRSAERVDPLVAALARLRARPTTSRETSDPVRQAVTWAATMRALAPTRR